MCNWSQRTKYIMLNECPYISSPSDPGLWMIIALTMFVRVMSLGLVHITRYVHHILGYDVSRDRIGLHNVTKSLHNVTQSGPCWLIQVDWLLASPSPALACCACEFRNRCDSNFRLCHVTVSSPFQVLFCDQIWGRIVRALGVSAFFSTPLPIVNVTYLGGQEKKHSIPSCWSS